MNTPPRTWVVRPAPDAISRAIVIAFWTGPMTFASVAAVGGLDDSVEPGAVIVLTLFVYAVVALFQYANIGKTLTIDPERITVVHNRFWTRHATIDGNTWFSSLPWVALDELGNHPMPALWVNAHGKAKLRVADGSVWHRHLGYDSPDEAVNALNAELIALRAQRH